MFGNDPFSGIEDLFNQLSGGNRRYASKRDQAQSLLNTIEGRRETLLIFDLSGERIASVKIADDVETDEYGDRVATGQKVLSVTLQSGKSLAYGLSKLLAKRKLEHTFSNGILEVKLRK
jgi:hypothetical protein